MLIPIGFLAATSAAAADFELISTNVLSSTNTAVTFLSIPQGYKHLQLRYTAKASGTISEPLNGFYMAFGLTAPNNSTHFVRGNGSAAASGTLTSSFTNAPIGYATAPSTTTYAFSGGIIDLLNYSSTGSNKTFRALTGYTNSSSYVGLSSGYVASTNAVSEWSIYCDASFAIGSRFSLYGIKG